MSVSRKRPRNELQGGDNSGDTSSGDASSDEHLAANIDEESGVANLQLFKTNRRTCPHCQQLVSMKTYKTHKRLYYNEVL